MINARLTLQAIKRTLVIVAAIVLFLIIGGIGFVVLAPDTWVRQMAGSSGTAFLGRDFSIDGDISIDWDWTAPQVTLRKVRVANLPKAATPNMVAIDEINFRIKIWRLFLGELNLPSLNFKAPKIDLEKFSEANANWDLPLFSSAKLAVPDERSEFPVIGLFSMDKGTLVYRDNPKKLSINLRLETAKGENIAKKDRYKLSGQGVLQKQPFSLEATGGSLTELRNSEAIYPLTLKIKMGDTRVNVDGTLKDPVQLTGVNARLSLGGDNLADLFYLTGIPLPPTPPYQIKGRLQKQQAVWKFEDFNGRVGDSDLSGDLTYDIKSQRDFVKARLVSKLLDMDDLAGFIGAAPEAGTRSKEQKEQAQQATESPRLLPDVPIDLTRLQAADMSVRLIAKRLNAPGWPLDNLDIGFNLEKGILHLEPFKFGVANGTISGDLTLNGQQKVPLVTTDLLVKRLSLKQFISNPQFKSLSDGLFAGRIQVKGKGLTLADVLATSNGDISLLMSGGRVSLLTIEAAGLDLGQALPLLLGEDRSTNIHCAVGDFKVDNGLMRSAILVFDTTDSNLEGQLAVNLKDETINAKIKVHPKDLSVLSARTPITVSGRLKDPDIGLDAKQLAAKSAGAVALGLVLSPIAAIIPFIELGLGEDSDCRALIQQAKASAGGSAEEKPVPKNRPR
jgi:AsmA family protein